MTRLRQAIGTPAGKGPYVRRLFATIAPHYDLITVLLSYGQDRRWKRRLLAMALPLEGRRVLDLACGTGDIALGAAVGGAQVVGLDLTPAMIALARSRAGQGPAPRFLVGDMLSLPFPDAAFDVVTIGYGLRNVPDLSRALAEAHRVLRSGGRLLSLDFNKPRSALVRAAYHVYLTVTGSMLGAILHGDPDTYRYIAESLRTYPGAQAVADRMAAEGFAAARWHPVLGGLLAIHLAERR